MTDDEQTNFESEPMWEDALQLRRWDDQAKDPTMQTPSLEEFLPLIRSCLRNPETLD
jgi:predicted HD phosphohydrolase